MSAPTLGERAIGLSEGDTLSLSNQWARNSVTRDGPHSFVVTGDLLEFRLTSKEFRTAGDAISYAMKSLASYQEGRAT